METGITIEDLEAAITNIANLKELLLSLQIVLPQADEGAVNAAARKARVELEKIEEIFHRLVEPESAQMKSTFALNMN